MRKRKVQLFWTGFVFFAMSGTSLGESLLEGIRSGAVHSVPLQSFNESTWVQFDNEWAVLPRGCHSEVVTISRDETNNSPVSIRSVDDLCIEQIIPTPTALLLRCIYSNGSVSRTYLVESANSGTTTTALWGRRPFDEYWHWTGSRMIGFETRNASEPPFNSGRRGIRLAVDELRPDPITGAIEREEIVIAFGPDLLTSEVVFVENTMDWLTK